MKDFWNYLRSNTAEAVRNYFAPLKHWRQFLAFFGMLLLPFIPFHGWFIDGYASMSDTMFFMLLSLWMTSIIMLPVMISMSRMYPSLKQYTLGMAIGGIGSIVLMFNMMPHTPFVGATDGLIIVENGQQQVVEHDDIRRYAPWDKREFIIVENAYGRLDTTTYVPCEETLCGMTISVSYGWSAPFIAANADNATNYQAITNLAFIHAVNVEGLTNADDIAPSMCGYINANLELAEGSTCPVNLEFSAQFDPVN